MEEEYIPNQRLGSTIVRELYDWVESCVTAVVCVILIFAFIGRMVGVNGGSMLPTLEDRERLVATHLNYTPMRGDIVVVTKPNSRNEPLIKRVIAREGEQIEVDFENNAVIVNGRKIFEPYILEPMDADRYSEIAFPAVVPLGCVFIMGDNRNNSWDSRAAEVGFVDERHILGKIVFRIWPYERMGRP